MLSKSIRGNFMLSKWIWRTMVDLKIPLEIHKERDKHRPVNLFINLSIRKEPSLENTPVDENSQRSRMVKDIFYEGFPDEIQTLLKMSGECYHIDWMKDVFNSNRVQHISFNSFYSIAFVNNMFCFLEVYTLWGRSLCPRDSNTRTIYSG